MESHATTYIKATVLCFNGNTDACAVLDIQCKEVLWSGPCSLDLRCSLCVLQDKSIVVRKYGQKLEVTLPCTFLQGSIIADIHRSNPSMRIEFEPSQRIPPVLALFPRVSASPIEPITFLIDSVITKTLATHHILREANIPHPLMNSLIGTQPNSQ